MSEAAGLDEIVLHDKARARRDGGRSDRDEAPERGEGKGRGRRESLGEDGPSDAVAPAARE